MNESVAEETKTSLPAEALYQLNIASKWAKFLAIVGFVISGLLFIAGLAFAFITKPLETQMPFIAEIPGFLIALIYIIIAGISFIPVLFLNSFANNVTKAIKRHDQQFIIKASRNLKSFFAVLGLLTILLLLIYFFAMIVAGGAAVMAF